MDDPDPTSYALARARVDLRLAELRAVLDRHEETERWQERGFLERVDQGLADLIAEIPGAQGSIG